MSQELKKEIGERLSIPSQAAYVRPATPGTEYRRLEDGTIEYRGFYDEQVYEDWRELDNDAIRRMFMFGSSDEARWLRTGPTKISCWYWNNEERIEEQFIVRFELIQSNEGKAK